MYFKPNSNLKPKKCTFIVHSSSINQVKFLPEIKYIVRLQLNILISYFKNPIADLDADVLIKSKN